MPSQQVSEIVSRTRRAQGLPPKVEDPAILEHAASLLDPGAAGNESTVAA